MSTFAIDFQAGAYHITDNDSGEGVHDTVWDGPANKISLGLVSPPELHLRGED